MAFGVKLKQIQTRHAYSIESFYEAIRAKMFTAGKPSLTKRGLAEIVTFPALDRRNQVQILPVGLQQETRKFQIQKAEAAGVETIAGNMALDQLTGGIFGVGQFLGKNAKRCEELVEITAKELNMIHL